MNYIILDLEWNSAKGRTKLVRYPFKFTGEIIQIGAVKTDESLNEIARFNEMVKPVFYKNMNRDVTEITSITDEDLEKGEPFPEVIKRFKEWCGEDFAFITWGTEDTRKLEDNLEIHNMDYSWVPEPIDAQIMFDELVTMEDRNYSLSYAIWKMEIKALVAHNALNDAVNTLLVMKEIGLDDVITWLKEEIEFLNELEKEAEIQ